MITRVILWLRLSPLVLQLYILLYLLNLVHGLARITQPPKFYAFMLGPAIVFILDKIISLRRYSLSKYNFCKLLSENVIQKDKSYFDLLFIQFQQDWPGVVPYYSKCRILSYITLADFLPNMCKVYSQTKK